MAMQKPGQPVPLQAGKGNPGSRLPDDQHTGLQLVRQRPAETEERR